jgi:hypothetical protein
LNFGRQRRKPCATKPSPLSIHDILFTKKTILSHNPLQFEKPLWAYLLLRPLCSRKLSNLKGGDNAFTKFPTLSAPSNGWSPQPKHITPCKVASERFRSSAGASSRLARIISIASIRASVDTFSIEEVFWELFRRNECMIFDPFGKQICSPV